MDKRSLLFLCSLAASFLLIRAWYAPIPSEKATSVRPPIEQVTTIETTKAPPAKEDLAAAPQYYVLESPYQQVVFSSRGGSIVEINLPFQSNTFPNSVVLPVESDRELAELYPKETVFPFVPAKRADGSLYNPVSGGYYPLLRRTPQDKEPMNTAVHAGLALTSQFPEFSSLSFQVTSFTSKEIVFEARQPHRKIKKRFSFPKDPTLFPYCLEVDVSIEGDAKDLWITSGVPEVEWLAGSSGANLKYRVIKGGKASVNHVDLPKTSFETLHTIPDWVCNSNGFFGLILDPLTTDSPGMLFDRVSGFLMPSRLLLIERAAHKADELPGFEAKIPFPSNSQTLKLRLFAGPFADSVLTTIDHNSIDVYGKATNYLECQTFNGWFSFISEPFAKFLFFIMKQLHRLFGSWGLCIILVTIVLRILMYPLNRWSIRSMRSMQEIAPMIKAIQEKHKKDPSKAQMEIMGLYRDRKVNPFSGCLPILIQMPFLIGMFDLLKSTFELRGVSFIPGWINDLSAPDVIYTWKTPLFLIGNQLHLLPIILGATMWWQQTLSSNLPKDPKEWTDQQRQQRAVGNIMTVVMTLMFYQFPSGLNIYWISSMILGIAQQWWTNRQLKKV